MFFAADILTITKKYAIIVLLGKMIICLIIYFERIKNMEQIKSGDSIDIEIIEHTEDIYHRREKLKSRIRMCWRVFQPLCRDL